LSGANCPGGEFPTPATLGIERSECCREVAVIGRWRCNKKPFFLGGAIFFVINYQFIIRVRNSQTSFIKQKVYRNRGQHLAVRVKFCDHLQQKLWLSIHFASVVD